MPEGNINFERSKIVGILGAEKSHDTWTTESILLCYHYEDYTSRYYRSES